MTPYYEGTTQAEYLIRSTPELVGAWLKKAKQDRSRLATRLFQPQKKEFLDGFISSLEHHLAAIVNRTPPEIARPQLVEIAQDSLLNGSPTLDLAARDPESVERGERRDRIDTFVESRSELTENKPVALRDYKQPPILASKQTTLAADAETLPRSLESGSMLSEYEPYDSEAERANGLMRLSGWSVAPEADLSELTDQDEIAQGRPDHASIQTGGPLASIEWRRVFEQARGVGMVDLSAYDVIDGLGELRDLIERWHHLQQDSLTVDHP